MLSVSFSAVAVAFGSDEIGLNEAKSTAETPKFIGSKRVPSAMKVSSTFSYR